LFWFLGGSGRMRLLGSERQAARKKQKETSGQA